MNNQIEKLIQDIKSGLIEVPSVLIEIEDDETSSVTKELQFEANGLYINYTVIASFYVTHSDGDRETPSFTDIDDVEFDVQDITVYDEEGNEVEIADYPMQRLFEAIEEQSTYE